MNEAFPAPQIGHIYYYMKIPAELAGHGGFVGDYAEKHVRIFAYLIVFFTFAILIMLFSKRAKSMKTGHKTHIPGIGNRKKIHLHEQIRNIYHSITDSFGMFHREAR